MKTIAIIACGFFDEWPRYGDLLVESFRHNPTVDFFLVTDRAPAGLQPSPNIKVVNLTLEQFKAQSAARLGVDVTFTSRKKVVDFKPAFGVIFADLVSGYDFWGYCDLDVIFGDIRGFLSDEVLEQYDVVSSLRELLPGHFTLFRNTEWITRLYTRSRDFQKVFGSEEKFNFEECGYGLHPKLLRGESFAEVAGEAKVDTLMHVILRTPELRVLMKTICAEHVWGTKNILRKIRWENGRVFDVPTGQELMYYHLHHLKGEPAFYIPHQPRIPEAFLMTRKGVFWLGKQKLGSRLTTAVARNLVSFVKSTQAVYRFLLWKLSRMVRGVQPAE